MSSRPRSSALVLVGALAVPGVASAEVSTPLPTNPEHIFGGALNAECQWPSAVNVDVSGSGGNCTGTLVHPNVVLLARHCGGGPASVNFGEDANAPAHTIAAQCKVYPSFESFEDDAAYCVLQEEATGIVVTPPLMGCETEALQVGASVVITGYGRDEMGTRGPKRWAQTELIAVEDGYVEIGHAGTSACHGDSGGPAFIQLEDGSWRPFGIVHGRPDVSPFDPPPDICGAWAAYVRIDPFVAWIEDDSGFDITPCHDAYGDWEPGPDCTGFVTDASGNGLSWGDWCAGAPVSGPSATCGPAFGDDSGGETGAGSSDGSGSSGGDGDGASDSGDADPDGGETGPAGPAADDGGLGLPEDAGTRGCGVGGAAIPVWATVLALALRRRRRTPSPRA